jgi:FkbM family methyltransferase
MNMKKLIKICLFKAGYNLSKINNNKLLDDNVYFAISKKTDKNSVFFDIGANSGQTIKKMKHFYPDCYLHSFEPSKICFSELERNFGHLKRLKLNNIAVGDCKTVLNFNEYSWSVLNSLLKRAYTKSEIIDTYEVKVRTIDDYCIENKIDKINLLKTDTEGYELNVLKGAAEMMSRNRIQFVHVEIFFDLNYIGQASFGDIYNYLLENGFNLVRFYDTEYTDDGHASKTDALFINKNFSLF